MKTTTADKYFSFFIRLTAADDNGIGQCCTCGKFGNVKYMDNGHYVGRGHQATRYNEQNCSLQCKDCNKWEEGYKVNHRAHLVKLHGEKTVLLLEASKHCTVKRSKNDIKLIADYYKKKTNELLKLKNIEKWW